MARQLRIHPPGGVHHVTARGNNRQPIFTDDEDRYGLLKVLSDAAERYGSEIVGYCLMANHVHFVLLDHDGQLSSSLRHVKGVYAQRFNQRHGRTGHLFEGRFWNSLLETDSYLATAVEYVHRNPVEAGVCELPEDYPWSSYQEYLGLRPPLKGVGMAPVMQLYGGDLGLFRASTESSRRDEGKVEELASLRPSPVLGSPAFRKRMTNVAPERPDTASSRRRAEPSQRRSSVDEIVRLAAIVHSVDHGSVTTSSKGRPNEARSAAMFVSREVGWRAATIAEAFGLGSPNSVAMACQRFEAMVTAESAARGRLHALRQLAGCEV